MIRQHRVIRNIGIADLISYRLPLPGVVSIFHRVSGLLLFLLLPLLVWLLETSLSSERSYARLQAFCNNGLARLVLVAMAWALMHHLFAGIRFLLLDLHVGGDREGARRGAMAVFALSVPLSLVLGMFIFGVI